MENENKVEKPASKSDEKLIAVICHAVGALVLPLLVYLLKKDDSPYLAKQAKQALAWQAAATIAFTAVSMLISTLAGFTFGLGGLLFLALPPAGFAAFCVGLYAAYKCWNDEDFKYPLVQPIVDAM
jgi:uncharacterized Tic20 family protein